MVGEQLLLKGAKLLEPELAALLEEGVSAWRPALVASCKRLYEHVSKVAFTPRGLAKYTSELEIPLHELDTPGRLILDIGAGAQNLARQAQASGLRSTVFSTEPRVAHPLSDRVWHHYRERSAMPDFDPVNNPKHALLKQRVEALFHPHPLTTAGFAHMLPYRSGTFDNVYASFSIPYWSRPGDIPGQFNELLRVLKPGAVARVYPLRPHNLPAIDTWLSEARPVGAPYIHRHLGEYSLKFSAP